MRWISATVPRICGGKTRIRRLSKWDRAVVDKRGCREMQLIYKI